MGRPHSHPDCIWEGTSIRPYTSRMAYAASRRREGRLRTPVVYKAGHQGEQYGSMEQYVYDMEMARTNLGATIVVDYGEQG